MKSNAHTWSGYRRVMFVVLLLCALIPLVHATEVNLAIDKKVVKENETVKLKLSIRPTQPVGGQLVIYRREENKLVLVRQLLVKPSPGQCFACARDYPIKEDFSKTFIFHPGREGEYIAEANFGGVRKRVEFNVLPKVTTTTSTITLPTLPLPYCEVDEECELRFSHCSCGWICISKKVPHRDCMIVCAEEEKTPPPQLKCECEEGKCKVVEVELTTTTTTTTTITSTTIKTIPTTSSTTTTLLPPPPKALHSYKWVGIIIMIMVMLIITFILIQRRK